MKTDLPWIYPPRVGNSADHPDCLQMTLVALVYLALLSACVVAPYEGPGVLVPPPQVYPYSYEYYYYPSVGVYYQYSTGFYYYPSGGAWRHSRILPPNYMLDHRDRVVIHAEDDRPYRRDFEYRQRYRPRPAYLPDAQINRDEREANKRQYEQYRMNRKDDRKAYGRGER